LAGEDDLCGFFENLGVGLGGVETAKTVGQIGFNRWR